MKTLRSFLITALMGFALMSFAQSASLPACQEMPLKKAVLNSEIVQAMHSQLNAETVLQTEHPGLYRVSVVVHNRTIVICGTYAEWSKFFCSEGVGNPFGKTDKPYNPFGKKSWSLFSTRSGS